MITEICFENFLLAVFKIQALFLVRDHVGLENSILK